MIEDDEPLELVAVSGYVEPVCGKDMTVSCVPAICRRAPGHDGECSVLTEEDCRMIDGEAREMLKRLFPDGLVPSW
jgi:hypothetical protein